MKVNRMILLSCLFSSIPVFSQAARFTLVEDCTYKFSVETLNIVKRTRGLHSPQQLEGLFRMAKIVCVDNQGLAAKENLSPEQMVGAIQNGILRAVKAVFESSDL